MPLDGVRPQKWVDAWQARRHQKRPPVQPPMIARYGGGARTKPKAFRHAPVPYRPLTFGLRRMRFATPPIRALSRVARL